MDQKQLFWLSAANIWCQTHRPKALETLIKLDTHVPGKFRVLGAYSNIPEFARDFKCPIGEWFLSFVRKRTLVKYQSQSEVIKVMML